MVSPGDYTVTTVENEEIRDIAENFNIETKQQQDTVPGATAYWRDIIGHSPISSRK